VLNPNLSWSVICFFLGSVGDASSFHSILRFNSGESLHPMNLLLRIESDLRFLFCRYLGPYLGFWHLTCTVFCYLLYHTTTTRPPIFIFYFSGNLVHVQLSPSKSEYCIEWIYCYVLNPNILIWHLFLPRSCRRCFKFNSILQFNSGGSLHSMNFLLRIESDLRFRFL
jgi:hypothetical protein